MAFIALGVTGGIGAYKSVEIARGLQKRGHEVVAIMTRAATQFVGPLTFEAITRRPVITDQFAPQANADIEHIAIASSIDLLLVAPATANVVGKFANGIADDFLSSLYLATRAPVLMAPAMNTNMLAHEAVQQNMARLRARGVRFVDPGEGFLACGWIGKGRLAEPDEIVAAADEWLGGSRTLSGRSVLVTAGPTYEDLDPVRYIGNRSSGRMGFAVAREAARRGARTILVTGPTHLESPDGIEVVRVRSARDMHAAVMGRAGVDAFVLAAAVADYTPADGAHGTKIAKAGGLTVGLTRTPDILRELGHRRAGAPMPILIGFAAETHDMLAHAREKLLGKKVDLIVANDVSRPDAGFEVETNAATLVSADRQEDVPLGPKSALARIILDRLESLLTGVAVGADATR